MFSTTEMQIFTAGALPTSGKFELPESAKAFGCRVVNAGYEAAYICFGDGNVAKKSSTVANYVMPGETVVLDKGPAMKFSIATDSGTTKIYLHAGKAT